MQPFPSPAAASGSSHGSENTVDSSTSGSARASDGAVLVLDPDAQASRAAELSANGAAVVTIAPPAAWVRGALAEHIDELIERELASRGAPSPYLAAWSTMPDDASARLADQLFRARTVGASRLALAIGSLEGICAPALTPEDSAALHFLASATRRTSLVMLLDMRDAEREAYVPMALGDLVRGPNASRVKAEADALAEADGHALEEAEADADAVAAAVAVAEAEAEAIAAAVAVADENELAIEVEISVTTHVDAPVALKPETAPESLSSAAVDVELEDDLDEPVMAETAERVAAAAQPVVAAPAPRVEAANARDAATIGVPVAGPSDAWRKWALALGAAKGPQPLAAFERLFTESYTPLANAIACGLDDPRALRAHDDFQRGFERSYTDAFVTFGATGRRPRLVMDAYDVAAKLARLHNARSTHVLLVDGMRYDLGCLVRDLLGERAAGIASLTSESLLWSALPTTTFRQLETLARGIDALRAPSAEESSESLRGRSAETVRRMRVGSRELYKLDVVPAMLASVEGAQGGTEDVINALDDIADNVADILARHIETLPARTLLLVVGDHGFTVDRKGRIAHGGASPEEVLVPAMAYLVGDLH